MEQALMMEQMQKTQVGTQIVEAMLEELVSEGRRIHDIRASLKKDRSFAARVYDPEFHLRRTVEVMAEGASYEELTLELGVLPKVIRHWISNFPEFAYAVQIGTELCAAWWKKKGRTNIHNPFFNNNLYIANMTNRFGWQQRVEGRVSSEHTEKKILEMHLDVQKMETKQLEAIYEIIKGATTEESTPDGGSDVGALLSEVR